MAASSSTRTKIVPITNTELHTEDEPEMKITPEDLPLTFKVKYIGTEKARGLWGIKHTRRPVDILVTAAKNLSPHKPLPHCDLKITTEQVSLEVITPKEGGHDWTYPIDTISYGVQDLVYTRVFAMIVVKDELHPNPFEVHAFVCDSRATARRLTFALAAAFQDYSRRIKQTGEDAAETLTPTRERFAIDLRTPEELREDIEEETEA